MIAIRGGYEPVSVRGYGLKLKSDAHSIKFIALQIMFVTHFYDSLKVIFIANH